MSNSFKINGHCEEEFRSVKKAFEENFNDGLEVGASLAVSLRGKLVVDLWGGYTDEACKKEWGKNTIVNTFSTTKVMTALCCHLLIDQELIDVDAPVMKYWPEFGQNGKENILVKHVLSHSAGLPTFGQRIGIEELYNWDQIIKIIENQKPWYEAGSKFGYHMITFGFLVGELVRRVSGKTIGEFFRDEIAIPLDIDFHIGLSKENYNRTAEMIQSGESISNWQLFIPKLLFNKAMKVFFNPDLRNVDFNSDDWRKSEIPSSNGHGNARSIAKVGEILACGGEIAGKKILSLSTIEKAIETQVKGRDPISLYKSKELGLGFGLLNDILILGPRSFYWSGAGGSFCVMDLEKKLSIGYAMNKMGSIFGADKRIKRISNAIWKIINENLNDAV